MLPDMSFKFGTTLLIIQRSVCHTVLSGLSKYIENQMCYGGGAEFHYERKIVRKRLKVCKTVVINNIT